MTRSLWSLVADEWDPEHDPALRRMRDALDRPPTPVPVPEARSAPQAPPVAPEPDLAEMRALRDRVAAGDRGAADRLRALLASWRHRTKE